MYYFKHYQVGIQYMFLKTIIINIIKILFEYSLLLYSLFNIHLSINSINSTYTVKVIDRMFVV